MATPVIGITVGAGVYWRKSGSIFQSYAAPVEKAGARCVRMGACGARDISKCVGLVLTGGWDIHPDLYDRMPGDELLSAEEVMSKYGVECEARRDEVELELTRAAMSLGMPILAICRGIQALNVVLAGKLIPDIQTCVPNALTHKSPGFGKSLSHRVRVESDSIMERAYGGKKQIVVNTRHHQGMTANMVPSSLRVTAIAPDGVVEAVEGVGDQFVVGVQWHPERAKDAFIHGISAPLFETFVSACRTWAQE